MTRPLVPCPACNRHVFADACACPFCQAALSADLCAKVHQLPAGHRRMSRAARVAAGAALLGAACGNTSVAAYGGAIILDGGPDRPADHAEAGADGEAGGAAGRSAGGAGGGSAGDGGGGAGGKAGAGTDGGVVPLYGAAAPVPRKPEP
jgi:hypothetical protein